MFSTYFNVYLCRDHDVLKIKLINHLYSKQSILTWAQSSWEDNNHFKVDFPCENDTMRALLTGLFEAIFSKIEQEDHADQWESDYCIFFFCSVMSWKEMWQTI